MTDADPARPLVCRGEECDYRYDPDEDSLDDLRVVDEDDAVETDDDTEDGDE